MADTKPCACCFELKRITARGLCSACYGRASRRGTVHEYPLAHPRPAGVASNPPPGMSYRQMDYWTRKGYLHPANANQGSGSWREWTASELRVAALMARLVDAGLKPQAAAVVARAKRGRCELAPGIVVRVSRICAAPDGEVSTDGPRHQG